MPYIEQSRRTNLTTDIDSLAETMRLSGQNRDTKKTTAIDLIANLLSLGDAGGGTPTAEDGLISELSTRQGNSEKIGGDMNFIVSRYLVLATEIHTSPGYEDKIQWIQEVLEGVREGLRDQLLLTSKISGILNCVSAELSRRYADAYEDLKKEENGDLIS